MSKSYYKSNTDKGAFINYTDYDSNKADKVNCHRRFRHKSKQMIDKDITEENYDEVNGIQSNREVSDVNDFASEGLKKYHKFKPFTCEDSEYQEWTDEMKKKVKRK